MIFWFLAAFHFHLLCDIVGAMGPDGYQWPVYYFYPLNEHGIVWSGQWQINAWPNLAFTLVLLVIFLFQIARTGFSPLGLISAKADKALVDTLRKRFGMQDESSSAL